MPQPRNYLLWAKSLAAFGTVAIGGPWLLFKLLPDQDAEFEKYAQRLTPTERKLVFEHKRRKDEEFDTYVNKLKEYSKSDRAIWYVQRDEYKKEQKRKLRTGMDEKKRIEQEAKTQRDEIRQAAGLPPLPANR